MRSVFSADGKSYAVKKCNFGVVGRLTEKVLVILSEYMLIWLLLCIATGLVSA